MKRIVPAFFFVLLIACNNGSESHSPSSNLPSATQEKSSTDITGHWEGSFSNGLTGAIISFDVSDDEKELKDLTFQGYWRCDGKLDLTTLGPEKSFSIDNHAVNGVIVEPEGGGATAIRFELQATFSGDSARGSFRMNINALGCDTYKLNWTAKKK